ncbi:MAG: hypothetical protein SOU19_00730 [Candidatus Caccosoma sp.]|nr:hypothetical protein [Candidatus Caccosoma sp.]
MIKLKFKNKFLNKYSSDYEYRFIVNTIISFVFTIFFAFYNLLIGIYYKTQFNISISVYYFLLIIIRIVAFVNELKERKNNKPYKGLNVIQAIIMLLMNISLFAPVTIMVFGKRVVNYGTISAITVATYTTFKVISTIIAYFKKKKYTIINIKMFKTIKLQDSLLSSLTLQNTLVMTFNKEAFESIQTLIAISSFLIVSLMIFISIRTLINFIKESN